MLESYLKIKNPFNSTQELSDYNSKLGRVQKLTVSLLKSHSRNNLPEKYAQLKVELSSLKGNITLPVQNAEKLCKEIEKAGGVESWQKLGHYLDSEELYPREHVEGLNLKIDTTILTQVLGDIFIGGTSFEGAPPTYGIWFVHRFLNRLNPEQASEIFGDKEQHVRITLIDNLDFSLEPQSKLFTKDLSIEGLKAKTKDLIALLRTRLDSGKSCFLAGGWIAPNGGHSINYEISKQENGKYTFKVFHRGAGIEYHDGPSMQDDQIYYPAVHEIYDIEENNLFQEDVWQSIIEIANNLKSNEYEAIDLFECILPLFGGKVRLRKMAMEELMMPHHNGTCTWKALTAYLRSHLSFKTFKALKYRIKQQAFWEYTHDRLSTLKVPSNEFSAYKRSFECFVHAVDSAKKHGVITQIEYDMQIANLALLEKEIALHEQREMELKKASAPQPQVPPEKTENWSSAQETKSIEEIMLFNPVGAHQSQATISPPFDVDDFMPEPTTFLTQLNELHAFFEKAKETGDHEIAVKIYRAFLDKLPMPIASRFEDDFWQKIDPEQATEIFSRFEDMYELFAIHFLNSKEARPEKELYDKCSHDLLIDTYKTTCIFDALLVHASKVDSSLLGIDPLPEYRLLSIMLDKPIRSFHLHEYTEKEILDQVGRNFYMQLTPKQRETLLSAYNYLEARAEKSEAGSTRPFAFDSDDSPGCWDYQYHYGYRCGLTRYILDKKEVEGKKLNPEIEFLKKIQTNSVLLQDYKKAPGSKYSDKQTLVQKIGSMFSDNSTIATLYPVYDRWRRSCIITKGLIGSGRLNEQIKNISIASNRSELVEIETQEGKEGLSQNKDAIKFSCQLANRGHISPRGKFIKQFKAISNPFLKVVLHVLQQHDFDENKAMQLDEKALKEFLNRGEKLAPSPSEVREWCLIATNPSVQVYRLIALFSRKSELLREEDFRTFFMLILFERSILSDTLRQSPESYALIHNFIRKGYESSEIAGDLPAQLFYLTLARKVAEEVGSLLTTLDKRQEWKERIEPYVEKLEQLNGFKEIERLLSNSRLGIAEKSSLYTQFIACCNSSMWKIDDHVLTLCIQAIGHLSLYPLHAMENDPQVSKDFERAMTMLKKPLKDRFNQDPEAYLQTMLSADPSLQASLVDKTWDISKFPLCRTSDREVQVHAFTGQILKNGFRSAFLPKQLQQDELIKQIYPPNSWVDIKGWNTFAFVDIHGQRIEITTDDEGTKVLTLKRRDSGKEWILQKTPPEVPFNLMKTYTFWYNLQDHVSEVTPSLKQGYKPIALVHYQSNATCVHSVEILPSKDIPEKCLVQDVEKMGFGWLKKVEELKDIVLLSSSDGDLKYLFLHNLNLDFEAIKDAKGNMRWMSRQHTGFYLDSPQHIEAMDKIGITNYLLLRNKKGEQQVLLMTKNDELPHYYTCSYQLSPAKDQRALVGNSSDANLFLAYRAYQTHTTDGYSIALGLLRPEIVIGAKPSPHAHTLTEMIFKDTESGRTDPMAIALRLRAADLDDKIMKVKGEGPKDNPGEKKAKNIKAKDMLKKLEDPQKVIRDLLDIYVSTSKRVGIFVLDEAVEYKLMCEVRVRYEFNNYETEWRYLKLQQKFSEEGVYELEPSGMQRRKAGYNKKYILQKHERDRLFYGIPEDSETHFLLTRPGPYLKVRFDEYLSHALKSENDPEKIALRRFLRLARNDHDKASHTLRFMLEEACDFPEKYFPFKDSKGDLRNKLEDFLDAYLFATHRLPESENKLKPKAEAVEFVKRRGRHPTNAPLQTLTSTRVSPGLFAEEGLVGGDFPAEDTLNHTAFVKTVRAKDDSIRINYIEGRLTKAFSKQIKGVHLRPKENKRLLNDTNYYVKTLRKKPAKISRWDLEKIPQLSEQFESILKYRRQKVSLLRQELLQAINTGVYSNIPQATYLAGRLEKSQNTLTINDVLILHGRKEHLQLTDNDSAKAQALAKDVQQFLDYATKTQIYERSFNQLQEAQSPKKSTEDRKKLAQKSLETFLVVHSDGAKHPERQVIEYLLDLTIRQDQAEVLDLLDKGGGKNGLLLQAEPGFGKTTLIIPLYTLLRANGDDLSVCLVPDQLLAWICEELELRLGPNFALWLRSWDIAPAPNASSGEIAGMHDFLEDIRKNKQALIIGAKAAHCFNIQVDRALVKCCRGSRADLVENQEKLEKLLDMEQIFQEKSTPIGDEAHIWLNTRREVNSASGELCKLPDEEQLAIVALYDVLLNDLEMVKAVGCEFDPSRASSAKPFTATHFQANVKDKLVDKLETLLSSKALWDSARAEAIFKFFKQLQPNERRHIKTFLKGGDPNHSKFMAAEKFVDSIKDDVIVNVFYLLAEELNRLLPATAVKKCDESYTIVARTAIPARNGMPLIGSEFGNPHETGNYSMQSMIKHGIPQDLVKKRIEELQEAVLFDLKTYSHISETPSYKAFCALCPKASKYPLFTLKSGDYDSLTKEINSDQRWRREFLLRYILPEIEFYTSKFNSNCYRLARLFPGMRAITGTLATNYAYASWLSLHSAKGADAHTLFTLYSHCVKLNDDKSIVFNSNVYVIPDDTPESLFNFVRIQVTDGVKIRIISDAGGDLNGYQMDKHMPEWQAALSKQEIQAVSYHRQDKLVVYSPAQPEGIPLKQSSVKPQNRLTVLLQPYVTGTDTIQADDAVELVTFGPTTTFSLLVQAVWRARKIHEGQKVIFCISENTRAIIRQTLGLAKDAPITLDELTDYSIEKEIQSVGLDNEVGARLSMLEHVQHLVYETIKKCRAKGTDYSSLFIPEVASLFEQQMPRQARDQYKGSLVKDKSPKILEQDVQRVLLAFKNAWNKAVALKKYVDVKTVEPALRTFIKPEILPENLEARQGGQDAFLGQEVTITTEKTKETAKQVEIAQEVATESDERPDATWPRLPWYRQKPALNLISKRVEYYMATTNMFRKTQKWISGIPGMLQGTGVLQRAYDWTIGSTKLGRTIASITNTAAAGMRSLQNTQIFNQAYSYPLKDFIATSSFPEISQMSDIWSDGLNITFNAAPLEKLGFKDRIAKPFDSQHKRLPFAVLRREISTKRWQLDMMDQTDAEFFMERLASYRAHPDEQGWEYLLVDLENEFYLPGPGKLTSEQVEGSEEANTLLAQAKFYNAIFPYTPAQRTVLLKWMDQHGKERMENFFSQSIAKQSYERLTLVNNLKKLIDQAADK